MQKDSLVGRMGLINQRMGTRSTEASCVGGVARRYQEKMAVLAVIHDMKLANTVS